jgi:Zn-finger nucleic acid-binding protein
MFDRIPTNLNQQPIPSDPRPAGDKTAVTTAQLRQTGTDVQNKIVQPTREFPQDSANISEEAQRAFAEQERVRRRQEEERRRQGGRQDKKKKKSPFAAYQKAQNSESDTAPTE